MANMSGDDLAEIIKKCSVILLDVAGTTTSIDFVQKTLHSYVVDNAKKYITEHWDDETIQETITRLQSGSADFPKDASKEEQITSIVNRLTEPANGMEADENLKTLHGIIYEQGYESGDIKGHVYDDVAVAFRDWMEMKKRICVYSSGSKRAQRLLFSKSLSGDLSSYITEYFDLSIGVKTEKDSYIAIVSKLNCSPNDIIFFTDSVSEAEAASKAEIRPVLVLRETEKEANVSALFPVVRLLTELPSSNAQKRKHPGDSVEQEDRTSKVAKIDEEEKGESTTAMNGVEKSKEIETVDKADQGIQKEVHENDKKTENEIKKTDLDSKQTENSLNKTGQVESTEEDEKMDTSDISMVVDEDVKLTEKQETNVEENAHVEVTSSSIENKTNLDTKSNVDVDKKDNEVKSLEETCKKSTEENETEKLTESCKDLNQKDIKEASHLEVTDELPAENPQMKKLQTKKLSEEETQPETKEEQKSNKQEIQIESSENQESHEKNIEKSPKIESQIEESQQEEKSCIVVTDAKVDVEVKAIKVEVDSNIIKSVDDEEQKLSKASDKTNSGNIEKMETELIEKENVKKTDDSDQETKSDNLECEKEKSDNSEELEKAAHEAKYNAKKVECETAQKELDLLLLSLDTVKCKLSEVKREHDAIQQQFENTRLKVEDATSKLKEAERTLEIVNQERLQADKKFVSQLKENHGGDNSAETKNGIENGISSLNGENEPSNQTASENMSVVHNGDASNCVANDDELSKLEKCETDAIMTEIPVAVAVGSSD